ncbi:hypothetical protein ACF0H5_000334 [Mactra antiquata]
MTSIQNWPPPVKEFGTGSTFDKAAYAAYEAVKAERDALKEADIAQKKRVIALEQETKDLLNSYQGIYEENKVLRSKLEHGPDAQRIKNFRSEIKRLEQKVSNLKGQNESLQGDLTSLQGQYDKISGDKKRVDDAFKMERGLHIDKTTTLEKENESLLEKIEKLERQTVEYEARVKNYDAESDGLLNRYKQLKRDNLKMESKFKKQKDLMDEELRDVKETNKEMAKEIIGLKTNLAKVQSDYNSVSLDYKAAQKQIDYQNKELDVFKTQSSVMRKNVKISNREYDSMREELRNAEDMLTDARAFGFEAIEDERLHLKRKERRLFKRIDELELRVDELINENNELVTELKMCRGKMESAMIEAEHCQYAERALKRRIEILENANIDLDRKNKYIFENKNRGRQITMDNLNITNSEKEKGALLAKCKTLETQNRRLSRRIKEMEADVTTYELGDDGTLFRKRRPSDPAINTNMLPVTNNEPRLYRKNVKHTRSLPGLQNDR